jgi:uncharacterized protein (TIGR03435 family)
MNLAILLCASVLVAAQPRPAFEVVSIKPVPRPMPGGTARVGINIEATRVEIVGYGLSMLIAQAFRIEPRQVDLRGFGTEFFEVQAKLPEGATRAQVPEMLQAMLAERFKLAYHRETREYLMTVVTLGKDGMKLQRLPDGTPESDTTTRLPDGTTRSTHIGRLPSLFPVMNSFGGFPQSLDQTGLDGIYKWEQVQLPPEGNITYFDRVHESFEALFDAAGLKLEERKVPRETIVVDHAETFPTEN